jgi:hypothetical protein
MSIYTEINFENAICEHLANHGWLYADGDASRYDRARALFPDDVIAWLQESQPDAWEAATCGKVRKDAIVKQFESLDLGIKKPWIFKGNLKKPGFWRNESGET